jgi:hypothetical protein
LSYDTLLKALLDIADAKSSRQSLLAIAQCISAVVSVAPAENFVATVSVFIGQIHNAAVPDHGKRISFFALGEIGRTQDLSAANSQVDELIFAAFRCDQVVVELLLRASMKTICVLCKLTSTSICTPMCLAAWSPGPPHSVTPLTMSSRRLRSAMATWLWATWLTFCPSCWP